MLRTSLVLDEELVRFLEGGCALIVCTLDPDGEPFASRAWGLTVLSAQDPVRVRLLATPDVVASGRIAITGTDVPTLRSTQLKGHASWRPNRATTGTPRSRRSTSTPSTATSRRPTVFPRDLLNRMTPTDFLALTVEVEEMYNQTPGPRAGSSLA